MSSDNERLGALVQRYQANSTRLAGLRSSIDQKAEILRQLAGALQRHYGPPATAPEGCIAYERSKVDGGGSATAELSLLHDLHDELQMLEAAQREKAELTEYIRQAGLTAIL